MSFTPISNDFIQYQAQASGTSAAGYFLKIYAAGTNTPISVALDSAGNVLVGKVELDSLGFAKNASGGATTLYIDQSYRLVLYVNATDADANTFTNAIQDIDDIPQVLTGSSGGITALLFKTIEDMKSGVTVGGEVFSPVVGLTLITQGYFTAGDGGGATYLIKASAGVDGVGDLTLNNGNIATRDYSKETSILSIGLKPNDTDFDNTIPLQVFHNARIAEDIIVPLIAPIGIFTFKTTFFPTRRINIEGRNRTGGVNDVTNFFFDNDTDIFFDFTGSQRNRIVRINFVSVNAYWTITGVKMPDDSYAGNSKNVAVTNTCFEYESENTINDTVDELFILGFGTGIRQPGNWIGKFENIEILNCETGIILSETRSSHLTYLSGCLIQLCTTGVKNLSSSTFAINMVDISICIIAVDLTACRACSINESYMELNENCILANGAIIRLKVSNTLLTCADLVRPNNAVGYIFKPVGNAQIIAENVVLNLFYATQYIVNGDTSGANSVVEIKEYFEEGTFGTATGNTVSPGNLGTVITSNAGETAKQVFRGGAVDSSRSVISNADNNSAINSKNWANAEHANLTGFNVKESGFIQLLANETESAYFLFNGANKANSMVIIDVICDEGNEARYLMTTNSSSVRSIIDVSRNNIDTSNVDGSFLSTPTQFFVTTSGFFRLKSNYTINKTFYIDIKLQSLTRSDSATIWGISQSTENKIQYEQDIV